MNQTPSPTAALGERLFRPQRVGVFGRRGAGKTTLLTMFYREAVGGRLPGLRLAAADARTADYLADKVIQLESGQPLPATLGETELRFQLYHEGGRIELLFKDYQGEHVALGRTEPIRDFLRDCDAVWLCLDVGVTATREPCLRAEQEIEQLVEDYLALEPQGTPHRPMALVLTKSDLLTPDERYTGACAAPALADLADRHLGMTRHSLAAHCPQHALMAVSSLGGAVGTPQPDTAPAFTPRPRGLEGPLNWLCSALQTQDEARLTHLWTVASGNVKLLERAVNCFARRYPDAPVLADWRQRLKTLRRQRRRRRLLFGVTAVIALFFGGWIYEAVGKGQNERFATENADDPEAAKRHLLDYQASHPLRHVFYPDSNRAEAEQLRQLDARIAERQFQQGLADLRRRAADPDADVVAISGDFQRLQAAFPDYSLDEARKQWEAELQERARRERARRAQEAFRDLERLEGRLELTELLKRADTFLHEHGDSAEASRVQLRRVSYLKRIDERDFHDALDYSARAPLNFQTRREKYLHYLDRHPQGAFVSEAGTALADVESDWDRYDFRRVRDHYQRHPSDLKQLDALSRAYLTSHPRGRYREHAQRLLKWSERTASVDEYRVTLKRGSFDPKTNGWLSAGLNLSVELEVNGVFYGPSSIIRKTANPSWDYEFPKRIRWKMGDSIKVRVTDHYYWRRKIVEFSADDALSLRLLSGETRQGKHSITFESDFKMPVLPSLE